MRAGFRVLEGIEELNAAHDLGLAARAAVNTGEAVVTLGGAAGEPLATGDVVNIASRLQSAAPVGGLIVGEETHRATRHAFGYEPLAAVNAKGKAEPLGAWLAVASAVEPAQRPIATHPLVGRDRELELVQSLWNRAVDERRAHLVTVFGPPGIGKTRFSREVSSFVTANGGRIVGGRCLPYEEQAGYQAFASLVKNASGILESDPSIVARQKLQHAVAELLPADEAEDTTRYLGLILGLGGEDRAQEAGLLFLAARRLVECLGLAQPTLVVFEDIHWAKPSELGLLEYLAKHVQDTSADDARPRPAGAARCAPNVGKRPPRADDDSARAALSRRRRPSRRAPAVGRRRRRRGRRAPGGGRRGQPALPRGARCFARRAESGELPVTVRAAIAARIDAMPAGARAALLGAAVIGKTFWRGPLEAMGVVDDLDAAWRPRRTKPRPEGSDESGRRRRPVHVQAHPDP